MKNLPNNIYLNFGDITKEEFEAADYEEFNKLDEYAVTYCENKVFDCDVEYVREDAFIEKANKWLSLNMRMLMNVLDVEYGTHDTDVKDFIEDFKKYMKGE